MNKVFVIKRRKYGNYQSNLTTDILCLLEDFTKYTKEEYNEAQQLLKLFNKCNENWNSNQTVKEKYIIEVLDAYEGISEIFNSTIDNGNEIPKISLKDFLKKYIKSHYPNFDVMEDIKVTLTAIASMPPKKKNKK